MEDGVNQQTLYKACGFKLVIKAHRHFINVFPTLGNSILGGFKPCLVVQKFKGKIRSYLLVNFRAHGLQLGGQRKEQTSQIFRGKTSTFP